MAIRAAVVGKRSASGMRRNEVVAGEEDEVGRRSNTEAIASRVLGRSRVSANDHWMPVLVPHPTLLLLSLLIQRIPRVRRRVEEIESDDDDNDDDDVTRCLH